MEAWIQFAVGGETKCFTGKVQEYIAFYWPLKNSGDFESEWVKEYLMMKYHLLKRQANQNVAGFQMILLTI